MFIMSLWVQCKAMYPLYYYSRSRTRLCNGGKDKPAFHASHHGTAITFLLIGIIITTSILFVFTLVLNQNHTAMAQQQLQANQTFSPSVEEQQQLTEGISFQIDNVTFSHRTASVNGIHLHYVIGGQGDPVVLLHGWPETWYAWHKVMPALAKNYTVIAPDLRGLGDSSKPPTGYDGKTVAEDIHQLVTQLGFNSIFLVGHDIGSQIAYSYAAAHPTEVKGLAVMDFTFPGFVPPGITPRWWFFFHQTPDVPEALVQGKEMKYLSWHLRGLAYNPTAITQKLSMNMLAIILLQAQCVLDLSIIEHSQRMQCKIKIILKLILQCQVLALGASYIPVFRG